MHNEVRVERGDTSTSYALQLDRFKLVKEIRVDRAKASLNSQHPPRSKLVKEVRVERGDTSLRLQHQDNVQVSQGGES